jgi:hypothetical protein
VTVTSTCPNLCRAILRHAQISITMEIHTQVPDKATRAALKLLSDKGKRRKGDSRGSLRLYSAAVRCQPKALDCLAYGL